MMIKKVVNLIFEVFHLKKVSHEGWKVAGVSNPDSVAEHSLNAAQIGYILAKMEQADANKVTAILVWHDIAETRIGDMHRIASSYIDNKKNIESNVINDQFSDVDFGDDIISLYEEYENKSTLEGKLAKEADYLEQAFQARIYQQCGYEHTKNWIDNIETRLETSSAKKILEEMKTTDFIEWGKNNGGRL